MLINNYMTDPSQRTPNPLLSLSIPTFLSPILTPSTCSSEEEAAREYDEYLRQNVPKKYEQCSNFCSRCGLLRRHKAWAAKRGEKNVVKTEKTDARVVLSYGVRFSPCLCEKPVQ